MSQHHTLPLPTLHFYLTAPYECSYLPQQQSRSQVATPAFLIDKRVYSDLVRHGFRRSGLHTYRPRCDTCQACVSLRIPVADFQPNRSQRRAWKQHEELVASAHPLEDKPEYFELYRRYQSGRHTGGSMDDGDAQSYRNFLLESHVETFLVEFREGDTLRMVSLIDLLDDGVSAVYTFYDPDVAQARYGVFNVLWQVELCRRLGLPYVYLGYWIRDCRKMAYKTQYQPCEGLLDNHWQRLDLAGSPLTI